MSIYLSRVVLHRLTVDDDHLQLSTTACGFEGRGIDASDSDLFTNPRFKTWSGRIAEES